MSPRVLGSAVGGLIVFTNARTLLLSDWIAAPSPLRAVAYSAIVLAWTAALAHSVRSHLLEREHEPVVETR